MKLFLTIFGAIIAASLALVILALIVIFLASAGSEALIFIAAPALLLAFPVVIDRALKRYGA